MSAVVEARPVSLQTSAAPELLWDEPSPVPRVSVVIVNYNAAETLVATLEALRTCAEPPVLEDVRFETASAGATGNAAPLEVLVIDNGSTDGSAELVRPPFRLIRAGQNLGFGRASNLGWAETSAPAVLFLNPDAMISGVNVLAMADVLDAERDVAAVGPRIVDERGRRDPHCTRRRPTVAAFFLQVTGLAKNRPESRLFGLFFDHGAGTRDVACLSGACMLVRRAAVDGDIPFDERFFIFGEDLDLCLRLGDSGGRIRYIDEITCIHAGGHSMSQVVPNAVLEGYRSWVLLLSKTRGIAAGAAAWLVAVAAAAAQLPVWLVAAVVGGRRADARARARGCAMILAWAFGLRKGGVAW